MVKSNRRNNALKPRVQTRRKRHFKKTIRRKRPSRSKSLRRRRGKRVRKTKRKQHGGGEGAIRKWTSVQDFIHSYFSDQLESGELTETIKNTKYYLKTPINITSDGPSFGGAKTYNFTIFYYLKKNTHGLLKIEPVTTDNGTKYDILLNTDINDNLIATLTPPLQAFLEYIDTKFLEKSGNVFSVNKIIEYISKKYQYEEDSTTKGISGKDITMVLGDLTKKNRDATHIEVEFSYVGSIDEHSFRIDCTNMDAGHFTVQFRVIPKVGNIASLPENGILSLLQLKLKSGTD